MIYNKAFFDIADQIDILTQAIKTSVIYENYETIRQKMYRDDEVQQLIQSFVEAKETFEQIESFGEFAPGFKECKRAMRQAKRRLDMNNLVSDYRLAENDLQRLLDEITLSISTSFSTSIKIDAGSPFFHSKSSCGGNCHA